jgi:hypothetical protein
MITLLLIIPLIGCLCLIPIKETEVRDLSIIGAGEDKIAGQKDVSIERDRGILKKISQHLAKK